MDADARAGIRAIVAGAYVLSTEEVRLLLHALFPCKPNEGIEVRLRGRGDFIEVAYVMRTVGLGAHPPELRWSAPA